MGNNELELKNVRCFEIWTGNGGMDSDSER